MKQRLLSSLLIGLMSVLFSLTASASPDRTGTVDLGFNVSGFLPDEGDYEAGLYYGGTLAYGINSWLAIGVEGGFSELDTDVNAASLGLTSFSGGEMTMMPLFGDVILRASTVHDAIDPYFVVGVGALFLDVDDVNATVGALPVTIVSDVDTAFAVKVGGGVDWFLTDNWILNIEASYVFAESDVNASANVAGLSATSQLQDVSFDYWQFGGGLKYKF